MTDTKNILQLLKATLHQMDELSKLSEPVDLANTTVQYKHNQRLNNLTRRGKTSSLIRVGPMRPSCRRFNRWAC